VIKRCAWVSDDELYIQYHDQEWGVPQHDDQKLFELLILEGHKLVSAGIQFLKNGRITARPSTILRLKRLPAMIIKRFRNY
jgi:hypothetical protein